MAGAGDATSPIVRGGGELAAHDAAELALGLAVVIEQQLGGNDDIHPDLYRSLVTRLRRTGTELAAAHGLHDLAGGEGPPAEGTAWANQIAALLRESPRERHDSEHRRGDRAVAESALESSPATSVDRTVELLDRSGNESFPASDPPSP